jgi:hypothetical protein
MSFAALATVLVHVALFGAVREVDEGAAAHIWQIPMAAQIPIIALFALKWLPRTPRQALLVLALCSQPLHPFSFSTFSPQAVCYVRMQCGLTAVYSSGPPHCLLMPSVVGILF